MESTAILTPLSSGPQLMIRVTAASNSISISKSKIDCLLGRNSLSLRSKLGSQQLQLQLQFKVPNPNTNGHPIKRVFRPTMESQDCTVKMEVDVPVSVAYDCYSDREAIAKWMPFISTVKILEDKPDQSRWTLKYKAFGQDIKFSWLARNLQPIPNQKIHWRSLEGLPNSGAVRFYPKGPSSCLIEVRTLFLQLTVSYEVPQLLAPVASALQPFLESLLIRGLERFSKFAKSRQPESTI